MWRRSSPEEMKGAKGIDKFIAYEIPVEVAAARYGGHFEVVRRDVHDTDDFRVLDFNGNRAFRLFRFFRTRSPDHVRKGGAVAEPLLAESDVSAA
jgi:hypothetical protein